MMRFWRRFGHRRDKTLCCQDIMDLSSDYLDDDLPSSIAARFRGHMDSCPECNSFFATFRATILTLRDLPKHKASPDLKKRIQSRIAAEGGNAQPGSAS